MSAMGISCDVPSVSKEASEQSLENRVVPDHPAIPTNKTQFRNHSFVNAFSIQGIVRDAYDLLTISAA